METQSLDQFSDSSFATSPCRASRRDALSSSLSSCHTLLFFHLELPLCIILSHQRHCYIFYVLDTILIVSFDSSTRVIEPPAERVLSSLSRSLYYRSPSSSIRSRFSIFEQDWVGAYKISILLLCFPGILGITNSPESLLTIERVV